MMLVSFIILLLLITILAGLIIFFARMLIKVGFSIYKDFANSVEVKEKQIKIYLKDNRKNIKGKR